MKYSLFIKDKQNYIFPFLIIAFLFLLSGYTNALLDVLNKYFQIVLEISRAKSALVQFALYSGYFITAIPAGLFIQRYGYNKSLVFGLSILLFGTLMFIPGAVAKSYLVFLLALFVIACGFTFFETIGNPYATYLGDKKDASRRLNLAQGFNGLGWIFGPLIGGLIIFNKSGNYDFKYLPVPYVILGLLILLIIIVILRKPIPELHEIRPETKISEAVADQIKPFWKYRHYILAVLAQFLYVGAQTGVNSFFINYVTEFNNLLTDQKASIILSFGGMGLFVAGRFSGSYLLKFVKPQRLLALYGFLNTILMILVVLEIKGVSIISLILCYFFMSVMYPTIFALGINGLGDQAKKASSYLVMAIVGGALFPLFMGWIADISSMSVGFLIPMVCFFFISTYGIRFYKVNHN